MKTKGLRGEQGQAAVFITLLLMFAFIALAALAIDGGHLYVVRRDLQNMADAGCLAAATELSLHGTDTDAYNAAVEYILANRGAEELYTPHEGSGVDLVRGIQVSGADVRVALQEEVETYFTMIFKRRSALVGARAHCNSAAGGGLLPIAVRRFQYNEDEPEMQLDLLANKNCQPPACYYHSDHDETIWDGRYGPMAIWLPRDVPTDGELHAPQTGNIDCDVPPTDDPPDHVGICVLGDKVTTNDGTFDYKGFVLLDARNIVPGPVWYYNGATGQANTNKDISKQWFQTGYRGPNPMVGDQLAMLDGVSNDFAAQEMAQYWDVGDEFVGVVYSGYVWDIPDLKMSIKPVVNPISPTFPSISDTVTYTLTLDKGDKPSLWESDANFELEWYFMERGGAYEVITPTVDIPSTVLLQQWQNSVSVDMTVYAKNPIETNYLSALTVRARETTGVGLKRWASTNFRYGNIVSDFTLYADALEYNVPQGGSLEIYLTTWGFGCEQNNAPLSADAVGYDWNSVFTSSHSDRIRIRDGDDNDSTFTLKVKDDAVLGWHTVRLTADPACAPPHSVEIDVYVYSPSPGGEPRRFVIVEGFAPFRVSYKDANTIGAYAIGPIVQDLTQLISGLNPRLLPW